MRIGQVALLAASRASNDYSAHNCGSGHRRKNVFAACAWAACEHRPARGTPVPHADLIATALAYKEQAVADRAKPGDGLTVEDPQHTNSGRLLEVSAEVVITRANPQIYLHGRIIKVPVHLDGAYMPMITNTDYMLFNAQDRA